MSLRHSWQPLRHVPASHDATRPQIRCLSNPLHLVQPLKPGQRQHQQKRGMRSPSCPLPRQHAATLQVCRSTQPGDATASTSGNSFSWPAEVQPEGFAPSSPSSSGLGSATTSTSNSLSRSSSSSSSSSSITPPWAAEQPTWNASTRKHMHHMMDLFTLADRDGNGILDREEVRHLLQTDVRCTAGICFLAQQRWVSEEDLDDIMMTYDGSSKGGLTFNEFMELVLDGVLLDGTFDEYRAVFAAADEDGDGSLDQAELAAVLEQLGQPLSEEEVAAIMASADLDKNSVIDFNEFLRLFHNQLLDLPRLLRYIKMKPLVLGEEVPPAAGLAHSLSSGSLTLVSGASQWSGVMDGVPPTTLLVAMFGLSTDVVCAATTAAVRELAAVYRSAVFVSVHIDASPDDKALFKNTLLGRATPAFFFFRGGTLLHSHAHPSAAVLERHLREHLPAREQPVHCVLQEQQQQQQGEDVQQQQQHAGQVPQQQHGQQQQQQLGGVGVGGGGGAAGLGQQPGQQQQVTTGYSMADLVYNIQD